MYFGTVKGVVQFEVKFWCRKILEEKIFGADGNTDSNWEHINVDQGAFHVVRLEDLWCTTYLGTIESIVFLACVSQSLQGALKMECTLHAGYVQCNNTSI